MKTASYLGVFLDALAAEVTHLTLFMHRAVHAETAACDYRLQRTNIRWVDLGPKSPAWDRFLRPGRMLKPLRNEAATCDVVLVRAPSPLAPAFYESYRDVTRICYLVVGDYAEGVKHLLQPWWRKLPIIALSLRNDRQLSRALRASLSLVNSDALYVRYCPHVNRLYKVTTTTVTDSDLYTRRDTCGGPAINVLFTGRIDVAKGLRELISAIALLRQGGKQMNLHIVGWEDNPKKTVQRLLEEMAASEGIAEHVVFHRTKPVGPELNAMYRMADIYAIPTYHEGFPRTIWEALANSLPVVASAVGSIPFTLTDQVNAVLIRPRSVVDIVNAMDLVVSNGELRRSLIGNGLKLAASVTLDSQTKNIVNIIRREYIEPIAGA
jgi:glycosyltransferase involved in cell wall biosynthesis